LKSRIGFNKQAASASRKAEKDKQAFYSEKVVYLPESFQANDDQRKISEKLPTRREAGLPESGFVFCSFNNTYKINPPVFDVWMRLLKTVAGSVLWLVADRLSVENNLRREAAKRDIEPDRLIDLQGHLPDVRLESRLANLQAIGARGEQRKVEGPGIVGGCLARSVRLDLVDLHLRAGNHRAGRIQHDAANRAAHRLSAGDSRRG